MCVYVCLCGGCIYWGLLIAQVSKAILGQFEKAGVVPKRKLAEFRITEDAALDVGTKVTASHFVAGQYVDVCGTRLEQDHLTVPSLPCPPLTSSHPTPSPPLLAVLGHW